MAKTLDLNLCFPEGANGSRGPLPKQLAFFQAVLDQKGPQYVLYSGGVGSGKTLIGCITTLTAAVMYPGDYLVGRLFNPELKITTYKTFLEICPPELIVEHRVADQIVKIRSQNGQISNVIFRGLDEPDKLRSLNLNGAYIDEGSQVSEEAFVLIQSRLRGKHVRKIWITTNPAGHSYLYRYFIKKDWADKSIGDMFFSVTAPSTENIHLPDNYVASMKATWSEERVQREIMGSWDAFEGMIYKEFRRETHVIKPFRIPEEWPRFIGMDHGYRNPAAILWAAVGPDGEVYIYREYYEREQLIKQIVKGNREEGKPGLLKLTGTEKITKAVIDPSVKATRGTSGESDYDEYVRWIPHDFPLGMARNDVELGIDRVKQYLKLDEKTKKPMLYIFDTCKNLLEELVQYRYQELKVGQIGQMNEKEAPVKANDHACDALRYIIMELPEPYKEKEDVYKRIQYNSLEGALFRDLQSLKQKKKKSPLADL